MIESPCLDCNERYLHCHSNCKKYSKYRRKLAKAKKAKFLDDGGEYAKYIFDSRNKHKKKGK